MGIFHPINLLSVSEQVPSLFVMCLAFPLTPAHIIHPEPQKGTISYFKPFSKPYLEMAWICSLWIVGRDVAFNPVGILGQLLKGKMTFNE